MKCFGVVAVVVLGLAAGSSPLAAAPVVEPRTGLSVDPPPGYEASVEEPRGRSTAALKVSTHRDPDAGCIIGFEERERRDVSLEDLNGQVAKPENLRLLREVLGLTYRVVTLQFVEMSGVVASLAVLYTKPEVVTINPDLFERRTSLAFLETPKGRTTVACVAKASAFAARRKDFEAIVRSVVAPR